VGFRLHTLRGAFRPLMALNGVHAASRSFTTRSLPSIAQSAAVELTASTLPGYLRSHDNVLPDPTSLKVQSLCAHLKLRSGGSPGPFHPWHSRPRAGLETHAGNRPAESIQKKCLTSGETRCPGARALAAALGRQPVAGSFDKKRDVRPEAPRLVAGVAKRRYQPSLSLNTRASESGESLVEPPPTEWLTAP